MKITYLHQYFIPLTGAGGTRSYEFSRRLLADGHQVTMVTSSAHLAGHYQRTGKITRCTVDQIPMVIIDVPYRNDMGFMRRVYAFLMFALLSSWVSIRLPTDVIFATSTPLTIAIPAMLTAFFRRRPMVFEVRDLWPDVPIKMGYLNNPLLRWLAHALEWLAYRRSEHIVCLSPGMAEVVQKKGIPAERTSIIPNSCDIELFASAQGHVDDGLIHRPDRTRPLIVYAGTFGQANGVDYLVEVASCAQRHDLGLDFLLVGSGAKWETVRQLAEERGILNRTLWLLPPVAKQQMPDVLHSATILCSLFIPVPILEHNSANKFFDGLASGKPIALNYGGWQADLLNDHQAGFVMPVNDPEQAAHLLAEYAHHQAWLEQAGKASREIAETLFSRDRLYRQLRAILEQAVR
jgi:glycosyltransferase involved in cell wall biosynthesis